MASLIGPKPTTVVWLANNSARTAHNTSGDVDALTWKTSCGRLIQGWADNDRVIENGTLIRWDSLDQQRIELCKVCWKGYTPVDSRTINELKWFDARNKRLGEIFAEAWVVISTPTHLDQFTVDGPGGNVVAQGTMLNYETLKSMLRIMLEEETHRKISRNRMGKLMGDLRAWEQRHPYGEPIVDDVLELDEPHEPAPISKSTETSLQDSDVPQLAQHTSPLRDI